jgi:two-component system, cell cycle sensor histidine kinase DivJ
MPRNRRGGGAPVRAVYVLRKFTMLGPVRPPVRAYVDALVHASARSDPLAAARHRVFIATRLTGVLVAFAFLPVLLVLDGAPTFVEAIAFAWCLTPLIAVWDLSLSGNFERAHLISVLAFGGMIATISAATGGIHSFAAPWLVVLPLSCTISASRRVAAAAILIALAIAFGLWAAGSLGWLPAAVVASPALYLFGVLMAGCVAAAVGLGAGSLTRLSEQSKLLGEARYRMLAKNMTDVITRHGKNGAVSFVSPGAEQLLGVPTVQLLGHGLFDRVHVADRPAFLTALADAASKGVEASVEYRLRRGPLAYEDATPRPPKFVWVETRCRALDESQGADRARSGPQVVAVTRDISRRKNDELALESARTEAERANDAKSRFLATMSHELRTPLNAIIGFSEMLTHEADLALDSTKREDYARLIRESGEHLLGVVNGILDLTRIESGHFVIVPEPFAISPMIEACREMMTFKAGQAGVALLADFPSDLPEMVADKRALRQVLINLLSNAIKFTDRRGSVTLSARVDGDGLVLTVADNGIGIAENDLERLGHPFFQARSSYDRPYEGTGLGLSVVKGLVELHGGRIEIASRLGEGTKVTVRLPLDCERAVATRPPVVEALPSRNIHASGNIPQTDKVKRSA